MKSVSQLPAGGVTARCGALPSLPLRSHRHPARVYHLQGPCTSSSHPLSLQKRVVSDLSRRKGANSLAWAPLRPVQPMDPAENKPELSHCSSTEALASAAMWSEPREFCLCDFLQFIVWSQSNWTLRVTGEGTKSTFFLPLHPSFFPRPSLLPHLSQSKVAEVESQVKEQKIGNMEKACHKMRLLIPSWGSRVIIHALHRTTETIGLLTQSQTLMRRISYTPTATWRKKESKICWFSLKRRESQACKRLYSRISVCAQQPNREGKGHRHGYSSSHLQLQCHT